MGSFSVVTGYESLLLCSYFMKTCQERLPRHSLACGQIRSKACGPERSAVGMVIKNKQAASQAKKCLVAGVISPSPPLDSPGGTSVKAA